MAHGHASGGAAPSPFNPQATNATLRIQASLVDVRRDWEGLAHEKPLWAALTDPRYRELSDVAIHEFMNSGVHDVEEILEHPDLQKIKTQHALDFGCGPGRLTQALASLFDWVVGVDISIEMLNLAASPQMAAPPNISFLHSMHERLPLNDQSFDFVLSLLVLQHQPLPLAVNALCELFRVIRPGGVVAFQLPTAYDPPPFIGPPGDNDSRIVVYLTPQDVVEGCIQACDCRLLTDMDYDVVGPGYVSKLFLVTR